MGGKKLIALAALGVVLVYVFTDPTGAGQAMQTVLGWLRDGAVSVIAFVKSIFS